MGLRPTKSDEGAAGGWRGINDLRRVFKRAVLKTPARRTLGRGQETSCCIFRSNAGPLRAIE
jgi:hypothetical protein